VVHDRRIDGRTLTFIVSGKLWRNSMIMQDRETGTLWSHLTGEALHGDLTGRRLGMIPSSQTTWSAWRRAHPETTLLRKEEAVDGSPYESYFADPERTGIFRSAWLADRLPGKDLVHGLQIGVDALAVTDARLRREGRMKIRLAGESILLLSAEDGGVRAYRGDEKGEELPVRTAYWFAWSSFFPNTELLD